MNVLIYVIIFIMGTVFGSFFTLAVYRIPKKIDIVSTRSFCPKCNHKLGFFELIPILSYLFLGGKCKECGQKIRIRYLLLEILSGLTFVAIAFALKFDCYNLDVSLFGELVFLVLYLVAIFIIAGIDKENKQIEKSVLYYAIGVSSAYIIYLCIMDSSSIYRYAMYLIAFVVLLTIDNIKLTNKAKDSYIVSLLILITNMTIMTGELVTMFSLITSIMLILIVTAIQKIINRLNKSRRKQISLEDNLNIGFYLGISNVMCLIVYLITNNWILK